MENNELEKEELIWVKIFTGISVDTSFSEQRDSVLNDDSLNLADKFRIIQAQEQLESQDTKQVYIEQAQVNIKQKASDLEKLNMEFETKSGEVLKNIGRDQMETFDPVNDKDLVTLSKEQKQIMDQAQQDLDRIVAPLKVKEFDWSQIVDDEISKGDIQPLFTQQEIAKEIYTPLVKELVFPEYLVPDEYSEVHQMISETNDYYLADLAEVSEIDEFKENIEFSKSITTSVGNVVKHTMDLVVEDKDQLVLMKTATDLVTKTITGGMDIAVAYKEGDVLKASKKFVYGIADSLGGVVGIQTGNKELGKHLSLGLKGAIKLHDISEALQNEDTEAFLNHLVDVANIGVDLGQLKLSDILPVDEAYEANAIIDKMQKNIKTGFKTALKLRKAQLRKAIKRRDFGTIRLILSDVAVEAGSSALLHVDAFHEEASKDAAIDKNINAVTGVLQKIHKEAFPSKDALQLQIEQEELEMEQEENELIEEILVQEKEEFMYSLNTLGQNKTLDDMEMKSISKMIEKLKKDKDIMLNASKIGSAGINISRQFVEGLATGATIKAFVSSLTAAIDRAMAVKKWEESSQEALNAVSPYYSSIQNFLKNQKEQYQHHTIKSAILLLQIASTFSKISMPVVGGVLEKGLRLAATLEDLTYSVYKKVELERAWSVSKKALEQPENRKLNLQARSLNPTLAKYSIAYGAVIQKDVIAMEAMNKIGLDRETLEQPDAKVGQVKSFLELTYSEDNKILKAYKPDSGWLGSLPARILEMKNWATIIHIAENDGDLKKETPTDILISLQEIETTKQEFETVKDNPELLTLDICNQYQTALQNAKQAFTSWKPVLASSDEPNIPMQTVLQDYLSQIDIEEQIVLLTRQKL